MSEEFFEGGDSHLSDTGADTDILYRQCRHAPDFLFALTEDSDVPEICIFCSIECIAKFCTDVLKSSFYANIQSITLEGLTGENADEELKEAFLDRLQEVLQASWSIAGAATAEHFTDFWSSEHAAQLFTQAGEILFDCFCVFWQHPLKIVDLWETIVEAIASIYRVAPSHHLQTVVEHLLSHSLAGDGSSIRKLRSFCLLLQRLLFSITINIEGAAVHLEVTYEQGVHTIYEDNVADALFSALFRDTALSLNVMDRSTLLLFLVCLFNVQNVGIKLGSQDIIRLLDLLFMPLSAILQPKIDCIVPLLSANFILKVVPTITEFTSELEDAIIQKIIVLIGENSCLEAIEEKLLKTCLHILHLKRRPESFAYALHCYVNRGLHFQGNRSILSELLLNLADALECEFTKASHASLEVSLLQTSQKIVDTICHEKKRSERLSMVENLVEIRLLSKYDKRMDKTLKFSSNIMDSSSQEVQNSIYYSIARLFIALFSHRHICLASVADVVKICYRMMKKLVDTNQDSTPGGTESQTVGTIARVVTKLAGWYIFTKSEEKCSVQACIKTAKAVLDRMPLARFLVNDSTTEAIMDLFRIQFCLGMENVAGLETTVPMMVKALSRTSHQQANAKMIELLLSDTTMLAIQIVQSVDALTFQDWTVSLAKSSLEVAAVKLVRFVLEKCLHPAFHVDTKSLEVAMMCNVPSGDWWNCIVRDFHQPDSLTYARGLAFLSVLLSLESNDDDFLRYVTVFRGFIGSLQHSLFSNSAVSTMIWYATLYIVSRDQDSGAVLVDLLSKTKLGTGGWTAWPLKASFVTTVELAGSFRSLLSVPAFRTHVLLSLTSEDGLSGNDSAPIVHIYSILIENCECSEKGAELSNFLLSKSSSFYGKASELVAFAYAFGRHIPLAMLTNFCEIRQWGIKESLLLLLSSTLKDKQLKLSADGWKYAASRLFQNLEGQSQLLPVVLNTFMLASNCWTSEDSCLFFTQGSKRLFKFDDELPIIMNLDRELTILTFLTLLTSLSFDPKMNAVLFDISSRLLRAWDSITWTWFGSPIYIFAVFGAVDGNIDGNILSNSFPAVISAIFNSATLLQDTPFLPVCLFAIKKVLKTVLNQQSYLIKRYRSTVTYALNRFSQVHHGIDDVLRDVQNLLLGIPSEQNEQALVHPTFDVTDLRWCLLSDDLCVLIPYKPATKNIVAAVPVDMDAAVHILANSWRSQSLHY